MNYAMILAAGVGQRMRNGGMPKQFLNLLGKPIIVYTLEKFEQCKDVDRVVIVCHGSYVEQMQNLVDLYHIKKVVSIIVGGSDRQNSLKKGLSEIIAIGATESDTIVIHDGVRPLVSPVTISENIRVAEQTGCAITVHPVTESVVITENEEADINNFKKRSATYSLTSPQTFRVKELTDAYREIDMLDENEMPLLDAAMVYAKSGGKVKLVKEQGANVKITTPEDFYFLKAMLELEENKYIFGL